jgi:hypothetical protein
MTEITNRFAQAGVAPPVPFTAAQLELIVNEGEGVADARDSYWVLLGEVYTDSASLVIRGTGSVHDQEAIWNAMEELVEDFPLGFDLRYADSWKSPLGGVVASTAGTDGTYPVIAHVVRDEGEDGGWRIRELRIPFEVD